MKKVLWVLLLTVLATPGCSAQDTFRPKFERQPWDTYIGVKGGAIYSNITALGGKAKITGMGGLFAEAFLTRSFAVQSEVTFSHHGSLSAISLNAPQREGTDNYQFNYVNTDLLIKGYLTDWLALYTGLHMARAVSMKCNGRKIKNDLHNGDFTVPVGLSLVWHNVCLDARYHCPLRRVAKTYQAKAVMGNAKNSAIILSLGYRFQMF